MDYYSFTTPKDGRLSWPGWFTHSGHLTREVVTCHQQIRHISKNVRLPETDVLTTETRRQLLYFVSVYLSR